MCKKQTHMNSTNIVLMGAVAVFTLSFAPTQSISAPSPSGWTDLFSDVNYGGPDGVVHDVIQYNNALIAAGEFGSAGGSLSGTVYASNIAAFDGSAWHSLDTGVSGADPVVVNAMIEYNGDLIVAGNFDMAGAVEASNIASWNSWTGWEPLGAGVWGEYSSSGVDALYVLDGELFVGGFFTTAGGQAAENIAKWDGNSWSAVGTGRPKPVHALTEWDDRLVAGGSSSIDDPSVSVACLEDGPYWRNIGVVGMVYSLATMDYEGEDDVLIAGGASLPIAGGIEGNLWHYDPAQQEWYEFEGGIGRDGTYTSQVYDLLVYDDKLIVTGNFHLVGDKSTQADGIAYWQGKWNRLGEGLGEDGIALHIDPTKRTLYAGGDIWYTGEINTENLGQYIFRRSPPGR